MRKWHETIFAPGLHNVATNWYNDGMSVSNISHSAVVTETRRDAHGRETARIDGRGNVSRTHRDAYGRNAGYALNGIRQTTLAYDPATGRLATMLVPTGEEGYQNHCPPSPLLSTFHRIYHLD